MYYVLTRESTREVPQSTYIALTHFPPQVIKLEDREDDDTNVDPDNLVRNIPLMIAVTMAASRLIECYILDGQFIRTLRVTRLSGSSRT